VTFPGLKDGAYAVEWWDTEKGVVTGSASASCAGGAMSIVTPAVRTDVACKVRAK
jgi:hypothetical protein